MTSNRRSTLKEVAKRAGVSAASVSFVVNGTKSVSAETQRRIEAAIVELNYTASPSARALRTGRHKAIGLLMPHVANPFFSGLADVIAGRAHNRGYAVVLFTSQANAAGEAQGLTMLEDRTDGLIWIPVGHAPPREPLRPTVLLDRPSALLGGLDSVSADHYAGGRLAADLARSLDRRRIGLLSGPADSPSAASRRAGLLEHADSLDIIWEVSIPDGADCREAAIARLACVNVDLVIAGSDTLAIGALRALKQLGRRVPDEVSLVGFDDIPWADLVEPALTTIRQPVAALAELAVAALIRRIEGQDGPPVHRIMPVELVERGSTARLKLTGRTTAPVRAATTNIGGNSR